MKWFLSAAVVLAAPPVMHAQEPTDTSSLLTRLSANYRACRSYRSQAVLTRTIEGKEFTATVALAARKPGRYRLSVTGDRMNTEVAWDGNAVTAYRPDRKSYVRIGSTKQLIGGDILKDVKPHAPCAELITLLIQGRSRDRSLPLAQRLMAAEFGRPQPYGGRLAWVLTLDYDADYTARAYVTTHDFVLRRVALYQNGAPVVVETHTDIEFDKPVPDDTFALQLPEGALRVSQLPPLQPPTVPAVLKVRALDGREISWTDLKGKVVFLTFFFTTCGPCNEEFPHLQELYESYREYGLEIVAVNGTGETKEVVSKWVEEKGVTFPVGLNKTPTDMVSKFGVRAYPTNVVFDREGKVIYKAEGFNAEGVLKALQESGIR